MTIPTNISYSILLNLYRNLPTHVKNVIRLMLNLTFIISPHVIKDLREILFFKIYIYIYLNIFFWNYLMSWNSQLCWSRKRKTLCCSTSTVPFSRKKIIFKKYIILLKWFYWLGLLNFFFGSLYILMKISVKTFLMHIPPSQSLKSKIKLEVVFRACNIF